MRQDPIRIVPYDPAWAASFDQEAQRLNAALRPWLVEPVRHIGSTAVPGLVAKPIIDMVGVVEKIGVASSMTKQLSGLSWVPAPEPTDASLRKLSYCTPSIAHRTHHLHLVERKSSQWRGWIAFRDHLRSNPEVAAEYGRLKSRLAEAYGDDPNQRDAYRSGKAGWITAVTEAAISSAHAARTPHR